MDPAQHTPREEVPTLPARAIQELAGHQDLAMTQRYMHLSPAALDSAIRLLDPPSSSQSGLQSFGDLGETGGWEKRPMNPGMKLAVRQGFVPSRGASRALA